MILWREVFYYAEEHANVHKLDIKHNQLVKHFKTPDLDDYPFDRDSFFHELLRQVGDFEAWPPDYKTLIFEVDKWSRTRVQYWQRIWNVLNSEYNPLWNYDRTDTETTDTVRDVKTDFVSSTKNNTTANETENTNETNNTDVTGETNAYLAGYDSGDLVQQERDTNATNQQATDNTDRTKDNTQFQTIDIGNNTAENTGENVAHNLRAYGNIGVTSSQQLVEQEIEVAQISMQQIIIDDFKGEFCLLVY